jgi:hypothetical protein
MLIVAFHLGFGAAIAGTLGSRLWSCIRRSLVPGFGTAPEVLRKDIT